MDNFSPSDNNIFSHLHLHQYSIHKHSRVIHCMWFAHLYMKLPLNGKFANHMPILDRLWTKIKFTSKNPIKFEVCVQIRWFSNNIPSSGKSNGRTIVLSAKKTTTNVILTTVFCAIVQQDDGIQVLLYLFQQIYCIPHPRHHLPKYPILLE